MKTERQRFVSFLRSVYRSKRSTSRAILIWTIGIIICPIFAALVAWFNG